MSKILLLRCKSEGLTFDPSEFAHFHFPISLTDYIFSFLTDYILKANIISVNSLMKIIVSLYNSMNILIASSDEKQDIIMRPQGRTRRMSCLLS